MNPTKERMNEVWREMLSWPFAVRSAFAGQLSHSVLDEIGSELMDAGMFDEVAGREIYQVTGCGNGADILKRKAREIAAEGTTRIVKVGRGSTPFTEDTDIPQVVN